MFASRRFKIIEKAHHAGKQRVAGLGSWLRIPEAIMSPTHPHTHSVPLPVGDARSMFLVKSFDLSVIGKLSDIFHS